MPQLAVAVVGAEVGGALLGEGVVAFGLTGAQIGIAAGSLIGGVLFAPTQKSQGPRLADLKAAQFTYGSVIPYIEGHPRVGGVIVWASTKRELSNTTSSGKGGGGAESTTFTYEQDVMFMLAENILGGVRKIWRNGELVWTIANDGDAASVANTAELWTRMTFYSGAPGQMPDPTYEAAVGTGNAPAYRTRACVFFEGLKLGTSGELANWTFEVVGDGAAVNSPMFDAPLGADMQDTITPLATATVTHPSGISFDGTWATFAGVVGTGNPADQYTAAKFSPASVRPITYEFNFKSVVKIDGPYYSVGTSCGTVDFVVAEALAAWNATHASGWVVAAGYPTYDMSGVPLKIKYSRTVPGTVTQYRVPHFYTGACGLPSDDYGIPCDPDYPYEYCLTRDEAGSLGAPYYRKWRPLRQASYLGVDPVTHNFTYEVSDYPSGSDASVIQESITAHAFTDYYEESAEFDFTVCTPGGGDPPNDGPYQFVFELTQDASNVSFGFVMLNHVLHLAAGINGSSIDLGAYTPPGGGISAVKVVLNGTATGSVQIYVDSALVHSGSSASSFAAMTLHGFGVDATTHVALTTGISSWKVQDLTVTMGADGTIGLVEPTLQGVIERQCTRGGLSLDFVDASALSTRNVRAMALTQIVSPRQTIEMLLAAYGAQVVESDVLRFSWRGGASVATIPFEDLVLSDGDPLPITKLNDVELPCQVDIKFSNVYDDYQDGLEPSDRLISSSQNTSVIEIPLGFTPLEAKRIADFHVIDAASAIFQFGPFSLTRDYAALEPTDVVTLTGQDGTLFRVRLTKKTESAGVLTFEAVSDEASVTVASSVARTSSTGYTNSTGIRLPVDTLVELLDIPILADADDDAGFYAVAKPATNVSFPGAVLFESADDVTFASIGSTTDVGTFGTAATTLASGVTSVFDEANSVTVDVGFGQLYSYSRDDILNGIAPMYLLGAEVLYARTATLVSTGVYTLTGLLRGRRGTEWAVGAHGAAEKFTVLNAAVKRVAMGNSDIGVAKWWKAVTMGRPTDSATAQSFADNAVGKKPLAPVNVRRAFSGADAVITWDRRSRLQQNLSIGSVLLGEDSEAYEIDITVSGVTTTYTATSATLTVAGGASSLIAGSQINVYQMSALVGRGYAGALTL